MIYEDLLRQYEELNEDEKNVLLVYKTRLSRAINDLDNEKIVKEVYDKYVKILENPANLFIKMSVLKDIDFTSLDTFKISLDSYRSKMNEVTNKLKSSDRLIVFRAFSSDKETDNISKGPIISTSLDINKCADFYILGENKKHYLYQIELDENSLCAVCPYQIKYNSKTNQLLVTTKKDQYEIMLNKNNYDIDPIYESTTKLPNGEDLTIRSVKFKSKEKETKREIA